MHGTGSQKRVSDCKFVPAFTLGTKHLAHALGHSAHQTGFFFKQISATLQSNQQPIIYKDIKSETPVVSFTPGSNSSLGGKITTTGE